MLYFELPILFRQPLCQRVYFYLLHNREINNKFKFVYNPKSNVECDTREEITSYCSEHDNIDYHNINVKIFLSSFINIMQKFGNKMLDIDKIKDEDLTYNNNIYFTINYIWIS